MNRRYVVAAIFLGLAACATSGSESPAPDAKVEAELKTSNPSAAEGEIEVFDIPEVSTVANISDQANIPDSSGLVCRREKITGSHRVTRVCRTRAEIERRRTEDQTMINKLRRKPVGSAITE